MRQQDQKNSPKHRILTWVQCLSGMITFLYITNLTMANPPDADISLMKALSIQAFILYITKYLRNYRKVYIIKFVVILSITLVPYFLILVERGASLEEWIIVIFPFLSFLVWLSKAIFRGFRRFFNSFKSKSRAEETGEITTLNSGSNELNDSLFGAVFKQVGDQVVISENHYYGSAYYGGLFPNDIILQVNGAPIKTINDLFEIQPKLGENYTFTIQRNNTKLDKNIFIINGKSIRYYVKQLGKTGWDNLYSYIGTETVLAFDTNFLINHSDLVSYLAHNNPLLVSKQVLNELDKLKTRNDIGTKVRSAVRVIDDIQLNIGSLTFVPNNESYTRELGLNSESPDDLITGAYCKYQNEQSQSVLFISLDKMARITARQLPISVLEFDKAVV